MRGISKFREYFNGMEEYYVLIGGAACYIHMEESPIKARVTKDLDLILTIDSTDENLKNKKKFQNLF